MYRLGAVPCNKKLALILTERYKSSAIKHYDKNNHKIVEKLVLTKPVWGPKK